MSFDATLRVVSTINVLGGAGVRKMKYFSFDGFKFSPLYLGGLTDEIRYGYLFVESSDYSYNYYDAIKNTIYLKFTSAGTVQEQGMIVHEATHTMFDFQGKVMTVGVSEALAYITQCMYVRLHTSQDVIDAGIRLSDLDNAGHPTAKDGVFQYGWDIAGKIIASSSSATSVYTVSEKDVQDMKNAVAANPNYKSNASNYTDFNGYR
jgi:hypothetical protein